MHSNIWGTFVRLTYPERARFQGAKSASERADHAGQPTLHVVVDSPDSVSPLASKHPSVARKPRFPGRLGVFTREKRFDEVVDREFPSDPASRRGRLVYRRPVLPVVAGWPESPQIPRRLANWPPGGCALGSRPFQRVVVRTPCVSGLVRRTPLTLSRSLVDGERR